jgi:hypothetical protein
VKQLKASLLLLLAMMSISLLARAQTPTPAPEVAPTPAVGWCPGDTTTAVIGVTWCLDKSVNPQVLKVFNGVDFVSIKALPHGYSAPSSAPDKFLWLNTGATPPILEECDASGCATGKCISGSGANNCGSWNALTVPNYGPAVYP